MKLENQICSLEQAKRLKELGCKQDSVWWWCGRNYPIVGLEFQIEDGIFRCNALEVYSAFTVAELMKIFYEETRFGDYPDLLGLKIHPNDLVNFIAKKIISIGE